MVVATVVDNEVCVSAFVGGVLDPSAVVAICRGNMAGHVEHDCEGGNCLKSAPIHFRTRVVFWSIE